MLPTRLGTSFAILTLRAMLMATSCMPSQPALPDCCFSTQSAVGIPILTTTLRLGTSSPMLAQLDATKICTLQLELDQDVFFQIQTVKH